MTEEQPLNSLERFRKQSSFPCGPAAGQEKVLRGGSWADCGEVVTVSYRMSRTSGSWREGTWSAALAPTIGFRLCRQV